MEEGTGMCGWMDGHAQVCTGMHGDVQSWKWAQASVDEVTGMHGHVRVCTGVHGDAQSWTRAWASVDEGMGMHGFVQLRMDRGQVEESEA